MEGSAYENVGSTEIFPSRIILAQKRRNRNRFFAALISAIMTGQPRGQDQDVSRDSSLQKYLKAMNNKHGVRLDMEALCKFVRETLFYALIHDARGSGTNPNDEVMGENGKACKIFVLVFLRDKDQISNSELLESTPEEKEHYLKFLWREGLQTKGRFNIRKALSNEKSAVYAGISESFKSKWRVVKVCYQIVLITHIFLTNDSERTST